MKRYIFKSIADLRFAIFILLIIACFSVIGTVIEQDQSIETYKFNYPLTNKISNLIEFISVKSFAASCEKNSCSSERTTLLMNLLFKRFIGPKMGIKSLAAQSTMGK